MNRQPGRSAQAAVASTVFSAGIRKGWMALCLLLFGLRAAAQSTCTVTRFDDTASVDQTTTDSNYNLPGLGAGVTGDLRYGLQQAIAAGGTWTINFASSCTVANPCTIVLSNPLPPIESGEDVVTESVTNGWQIASQTITTAPPPLTLTIDGGEFGEVVIDGNSGGTLAGASTTNRVFFVDSGTVTLANLQIQNALAQGGAGGGGGNYNGPDRGEGGFGGGNGDSISGGGGGGAAFGPAIFVNAGSLATYNSGAFNDESHVAATAGAAGYGTATAGAAVQTPVFNAFGTVNGVASPYTHQEYLNDNDPPAGGVASALPAALPVWQ